MKLWFWNWSCQLIVSQLLIFLHPCCCMTQQHRFELARKAQKKCIAFLLFVEGRMQHLYYWMVGTCPLVLQIAWLSAPLYCGLWVLLCPWSALEQLCQGQLLPPASIGRNPALPFVLALECLLQTAAEGLANRLSNFWNGNEAITVEFLTWKHLSALHRLYAGSGTEGTVRRNCYDLLKMVWL